jgi:hypothetical protein
MKRAGSTAYNVTLEASGGNPGKHVNSAESAQTCGHVLVGQEFTVPADLTAASLTLDYQAYDYNAWLISEVHVMIIEKTVWDAFTDGGSFPASVFSEMLQSSSAPSIWVDITDWTRKTTTDNAALLSALTSRAGQRVVAVARMSGTCSTGANEWTKFDNLLFNYTSASEPAATLGWQQSYPLFTMDYGSTYYWRVQYKDDTGGWSLPSDETAFTTMIDCGVCGDGSDSAVTIATPKNINTDVIAAGRSYADGIAYRVNAPADGASSVSRFSGSDVLSNGIAAGDEVVLINLQGASGDVADVGNYEFITVESVTASTLTFTDSITKSFEGGTPGNQKVVIQRVPHYTSVTISDSLTASAWDGLTTTPSGSAGYYTGIVSFRATGDVTVSGSITVSAKGYRGAPRNTSGGTIGKQGESLTGTGIASASRNDGGGGGGSGQSNAQNGGGGGGYGTAGSQGIHSFGGGSGGQGGNSYGSAAIDKLYLGSGGGTGSNDGDVATYAGRSGNGGGIAIIYAASFSGSVESNGENAEDSAWGDNADPGGSGGGAGGSIYVIADNIESSTLNATGGPGGADGAQDQFPAEDCDGGNGGDGRIRFDGNTSASVTSSPAAYEGTF